MPRISTHFASMQGAGVQQNPQTRSWGMGPVNEFLLKWNFLLKFFIFFWFFLNFSLKISGFCRHARSWSPAESTDREVWGMGPMNGGWPGSSQNFGFGNVILILISPIHLTPKDTHGNITKFMHYLCAAQSHCLKRPMVNIPPKTSKHKSPSSAIALTHAPDLNYLQFCQNHPHNHNL